MEMRDFGILAGVFLGILNFFINYQKNRRDARKIEKEEKEKEEQKKKEQIENEKAILKNALINMDIFARDALTLLNEYKGMPEKKRSCWYLETRIIHLSYTMIQDYKFNHMKTFVKNMDNQDIRAIYDDVDKVRNLLIDFRRPFRPKHDSSKGLITDDDVNEFGKIQQHIDVLLNKYKQIK